MRVTEQYTFFWNGPFSQWEPSQFILPKNLFEEVEIGWEPVKFNCAEQYMMYHKAILFDDMNSAFKIMSFTLPRDQKAQGRKVKSFNLDMWNAVSRDIVYRGSYYKFTQNKKLENELLNTAPTTLVEASPYDIVWGIGMDEYDIDVETPSRWKGTNWLGQVLTQLREDLMNDSISFGSDGNPKFRHFTDSSIYKYEKQEKE